MNAEQRRELYAAVMLLQAGIMLTKERLRRQADPYLHESDFMADFVIVPVNQGSHVKVSQFIPGSEKAVEYRVEFEEAEEYATKNLVKKP